VILYTRQDFVGEVKRLTNGKGLNVVYDAVGKDTFDKGFDCLVPRGMMVLYGQSSGPVGPFDLQVLNAKGSLFATRPSLNHPIATREELLQRAGELASWIRDGQPKPRMEIALSLQDAAEAPRAVAGRETARSGTGGNSERCGRISGAAHPGAWPLGCRGWSGLRVVPCRATSSTRRRRIWAGRTAIARLW